MLAGDVKRVLVGFSARVAEKDPVQRARAQLRESLREYLAVLMRDGARIEEEPLRLVRDGPNNVGMRVAGGGDRVPAVGVEPLIARFIDQPGAPAADGRMGNGMTGEERDWRRRWRLSSAWEDPPRQVLPQPQRSSSPDACP